MKLITQIGTILLFSVLCLGAKAQCNANFTYTVNANGQVTFSSSSTPANATTNYVWWFGTSNPNSNVSYTGTPIANYTYMSNGNYSVTLTIFNSSPSCSATINIPITITTSTCGLQAGMNQTQGTNGVVNFSDNSTGVTSSTIYYWNFGDNSSSNLQNPVHTYSANGWYYGYFRAANAVNCIDSVPFSVFVSSYCNMTPSFSYSQGPNGNVTLWNTTTNSQPWYSYNWLFNNSSPQTGSTVSTVLSNGTYTVMLVVAITPTSSCMVNTQQVITVTSNTCFLQSGISFTQGLAGLVNFASVSSNTNISTTYNWNFGNGFTSTAANNPVTYINGGVHVVTFTASNGPNCNSISTTTVNITSVPCTANANFTLVNVSPLYWNAIPVYPYNVTGVQWSWGNGFNTFQMYSSMSYSFAGLYNICLTVTVSCGATASACTNYSIYKGAPAMINVNVVEPQKTKLSTGIENKQQLESLFVLAPNPNSGSFKINIDGLHEGVVKINIHDALGRSVYSDLGHSNGSLLTKEVDLDLKSGIYILNIDCGDRTITRKILVDK